MNISNSTKQHVKISKKRLIRITKRLAEHLHDKILFMANTGIRPDEANWLEYRDVEIVEDDATGETILEIEVRGKRGVGYCKSTIGAVRPFQRMIERNQPEPTDRLFPVDHKKQFNRILEEEGLKTDRQGDRRRPQPSMSAEFLYACRPSACRSCVDVQSARE